MTEKVWADLIALVGLVLVLGGIYLLSPVAALIVAGIVLIIIGFGKFVQADNKDK